MYRKSKWTSIGKTTEVTVHWIPGHQDYDGNEIADLLANYGRTMLLKPTHSLSQVVTLSEKLKTV